MRELTQQEIADKPEWATHYYVCDNDQVMWESDRLWQHNKGSLANTNAGGISFNAAKIIAENKKDKTRYEFNHSSIAACYVPDGIKISVSGGCEALLSDSDIMALAQARNLTIGK